MRYLTIHGYALLLVSAIELSLVLLMLRRNRYRQPVIRAIAILGIVTAVYCALCGTVYARGARGLDYDLLYRWCWIGYLAIPATLHTVYHLSPRPGPLLRAAIPAQYALWTVALVLCLTTDWVDVGPSSLAPYIDQGGALEKPFRLLSALSCGYVVYEIVSVMRLARGIRRLQAAYLLFGLLVYALTAGGFTSGLAQLIPGLRWDPALSCYLSLPWVGLTYYGITRYRLFEIRLLAGRLVTLLLMGLLLVATHWAIARGLSAYIAPSWAVALALAVILALVFATPLPRWFQHDLTQTLFSPRHETHQRALRQATDAIIKKLDLDELLQYLIQVTAKTLHVPRVALLLRTDDDAYRVRTHLGLDPVVAESYEAPRELLRWLRTTGDTFIREEQAMTLPEDYLTQLSPTLDPLGAEMITPLFFEGQLMGALALDAKGTGEPYLRSEIELLETLANSAAVAITNARLYVEAITDGLTGLYHQRHFKYRVRQEIARARRYERPLSLIMIDVDHFKHINDSCGHPVGDSVLRGLARTLRSETRAVDIVARYGGEEFAVLLPETPLESAAEVAERIRANVLEARLHPNLPVSISLGVSAIADTSKEIDAATLIARADDCLYRAKKNGRNRVEQWTEPESDAAPARLSVCPEAS